MLFRHRLRSVDLVNACRVFVQVGEHGSFTLGASAARVPQSVASRRVAALEEHFGQPLFDRSARRAVLTAFGRDMLAPAKRLVQLADALEYHAQEAKLRPLTLALPETCDVRRLARLDAEARDAGLMLELRGAGPAARAESLRSREVRVCVEAVAPADATWTVPLGLASSDDRATAPVRLSSLRPSRVEARYRRIWLQPEDDVPHVRDALRHAGHRAALLPAQIAVASSLVAAVGAALRSRADFLLCSAQQADDLGLAWRPIAGTDLARGYVVSAMTGDDAARVQDVLGDALAQALGGER